MPIDTSIYGNLQAGPQIQQANPLATLAGVAQLQHYQQQADQYNRALAQEQGINRVYQSAVDPTTGTIDRNKLLAGVAGGGYGTALPSIQKSFAEADKAGADVNKTQIETALKQREAFGGILQQAAANPGMVQTLIQSAVDQKIVAPEYAQKILQGAAQSGNPADFFMTGAKASIAAKDQMEQQLKQQQIGVTMRGQDMTAQTALSGQNVTMRGQDMQASTAQQGQAVTMRGQDMVNARSQDGNVPSGYRRTADGTGFEYVPGGPADPNTPKGKNNLNDTQAKALQFGTRMEANNKIFDELEGKGVTTSLPGTNVGYGVGATLNALQPQDRQRLDAAKRDFIAAVLRRESGAAIAQSEFDSTEKQYFPQPGEGADVKAQKKALRERATRGILAEVPDAQNRIAQVQGSAPASPAAPALNNRAALEAELKRRGLLK